MAPAIPDRWTFYIPIGDRIPGTRFVAFKVPLRRAISDRVDEKYQLTCDTLMDQIPNLGMVIDLTNTNRYYDPIEFRIKNIKYEKLMIPGREIPPKNAVCAFKSMVKNFLRDNQYNDKLIGVHCTHGVNRTGYLICNYMISGLKMSPRRAIFYFQTARGHNIERENYIKRLYLADKRPISRSELNVYNKNVG